MKSKGKRGTATISLTQAIEPGHADILGSDALKFVAALASTFGSRVDDLLARRTERQKAITNGAMPDFLPETREIRAGDWKVGPIPEDLLDRRVEITGPTDRKMIINALNSGARVFMADCEDSMTPTWRTSCRPGQSVRCGQWHDHTGAGKRTAQRNMTLIVNTG
jgi:malate synthase